LEDFGGVDIVLNSLSGPGFKVATLAVCIKGARLIEMSKLNPWTIEEINSMHDDVFYKIAEISLASKEDMTED